MIKTKTKEIIKNKDYKKNLKKVDIKKKDNLTKNNNLKNEKLKKKKKLTKKSSNTITNKNIKAKKEDKNLNIKKKDLNKNSEIEKNNKNSIDFNLDEIDKNFNNSKSEKNSFEGDLLYSLKNAKDMEKAAKKRRSTFFKNLLFNCQFDKIDKKYDLTLNFTEESEDITKPANLSNMDKMFFYEIMENDDSINSLNNSFTKKENLKKNPKEELFSTFLEFRKDKDKYLYNKTFSKILCLEIIKKIQKEIKKIDYQKHSYIKENGIVLLNTQLTFKLTFFSNFYLNHIEGEYLKIREDFETNPYLTNYIKIFSLIEDKNYKTDTEGVPAVIRKLKNYTPQKIPMKNKIKIELITKNNLLLFDANQAFKNNQLTGYFCHIIRDIVFFLGIVCNRNYSLPENYNTISFYKFLNGKRKYYNSLIDDLGRIMD